MKIDFWTPGRGSLLERRLEDLLDLAVSPEQVAEELVADFHRTHVEKG
jgi:hypothetical protein